MYHTDSVHFSTHLYELHRVVVHHHVNVIVHVVLAVLVHLAHRESLRVVRLCPVLFVASGGGGGIY